MRMDMGWDVTRRSRCQAFLQTPHLQLHEIECDYDEVSHLALPTDSYMAESPLVELESQLL